MAIKSEAFCAELLLQLGQWEKGLESVKSTGDVPIAALLAPAEHLAKLPLTAQVSMCMPLLQIAVLQKLSHMHHLQAKFPGSGGARRASHILSRSKPCLQLVHV